VAQNGIQALDAQLRASAPAGVRRLADEHLVDLAEAIKAARRRQAAELATAGDQALTHIPRVLRGAVRKALG
jgi:hypothetical protein